MISNTTISKIQDEHQAFVRTTRGVLKGLLVTLKQFPGMHGTHQGVFTAAASLHTHPCAQESALHLSNRPLTLIEQPPLTLVEMLELQERGAAKSAPHSRLIGAFRCSGHEPTHVRRTSRSIRSALHVVVFIIIYVAIYTACFVAHQYGDAECSYVPPARRGRCEGRPGAPQFACRAQSRHHTGYCTLYDLIITSTIQQKPKKAARCAVLIDFEPSTVPCWHTQGRRGCSSPLNTTLNSKDLIEFCNGDVYMGCIALGIVHIHE